MLALQQNNTPGDFQDNDPLEGIRIEDQDQDLNEDGYPLDAEEKLLNTPTIPKEVYSVLPTVLKEGSEMFSSTREKDVFLTSALAILSGCFPNVYGRYDQKKVHPNLFHIVIAPPASGKSAMMSAKDLGFGIHEELKKQQFASYDLNSGSSTPDLGNFLFIPGNISSAGMIDMLLQSNGTGIIAESEVDTLSSALKQEWGGFSDMLRKAFHHETISKKRKNEFIEIKRPKMSLALTGTFNQLQPFINSVGDGLFSRFSFYTYKSTPKWRDPSSKPHFIYDTYMQGLQDRIKAIYEFTKGQEYCFDLTVIQWSKLNKLYDSRLNKTVAFQGVETSGTILRLALMQFRTAMTLSILRFFETNSSGNSITCSDLDYTISELLSELYLRHGLLVYSFMMKNKSNGVETNIEKFFKALPVIPFKRKDAVATGKLLGIAERTVGKYLRRLKQSGFLKQDVPQGEYQKLSQC